MITTDWEMLYGLPQPEYLEFVARYLLPAATGLFPIDPFPIDLTPDQLLQATILRPDCDACARSPQISFFLSGLGGGKSTLAQITKARITPNLVVLLDLNDYDWLGSEEDILTGKRSILTIERLVPQLFNAYWVDLFQDPGKRARFFSTDLLKDTYWRAAIHWFYHAYPPLQQVVFGEPALMRWLNTSLNRPLLSDRITSAQALRELQRLILYDPSPGQTDRLRPYCGVQVLIDNVDDLSERAIERLLQDTQRLYALRIPGFSFKLFIDQVWESKVYTLECVRQGRLGVYRLPEWTIQDIQAMLGSRLAYFRPGEGTDQHVIVIDWGRSLPKEWVHPSVGKSLTFAIARAAVSVYENPRWSNIDAPIHALRLARSILTECSRRWKNGAASEKLTAAEVSCMIEKYQQAFKEKMK